MFPACCKLSSFLRYAPGRRATEGARRPASGQKKKPAEAGFSKQG